VSPWTPGRLDRLTLAPPGAWVCGLAWNRLGEFTRYPGRAVPGDASCAQPHRRVDARSEAMMRQGVIETIVRETRSDKPCKTMPAGRPCSPGRPDAEPAEMPRP
jgi:hypothetical protein